MVCGGHARRLMQTTPADSGIANVGRMCPLHRCETLASALSRAARRAIALQLLVACLALLWVETGHAQPDAKLSRIITVERALPGCISERGLRDRVQQYLARQIPVDGLRIVVDLAEPRFRVLHAGALVAERRFERPPARCSERRDALALAIVLAIEHAVAQLQGQTETALTTAQPAPETRQAELGAEAAATTPGAPSSGAEQQLQPSAPEHELAGGTSETGSRAGAQRQLPAAGSSRAPPRTNAERSARVEAARAPAVAEADGGGALRGDASRSGREQDAERRGRFWLTAGARYLTQALPTPAAVAALGAEHALAPFLRWGASALVSLPADQAFAGARASSQLFGAEALLCLHGRAGPLALHGCAGASAAWVRASGHQFAQDLSDSMAWLAWRIRAKLEVPAASRLSVALLVDAHANVLRPELRAGGLPGAEQRQAVAAVGGCLGAELIWRLD